MGGACALIQRARHEDTDATLQTRNAEPGQVSGPPNLT